MEPQAPVVVAPEPETTESSRAPRGHAAPGGGPSHQHQLDGVTESADWGWDDPGDFSAPV